MQLLDILLEATNSHLAGPVTVLFRLSKYPGRVDARQSRSSSPIVLSTAPRALLSSFSSWSSSPLPYLCDHLPSSDSPSLLIVTPSCLSISSLVGVSVGVGVVLVLLTCDFAGRLARASFMLTKPHRSVFCPLTKRQRPDFDIKLEATTSKLCVGKATSSASIGTSASLGYDQYTRDTHLHSSIVL